MSLIDKKDPVRFSVSSLEAAILMHALVQGGEELSLSADNTLRELMDMLEYFRRPVNKEVLQASLYSCNMLHEQGKFWHPGRLTFDEFLRRVVPHDMTFNKTYNLIERKVK